MAGLKGKVILITGAASGIGRATAVKLSSLGAKLALSDIDHNGVKQTATLCLKGATSASPVDVGNADQCDDFIKGAVHDFGHIDHVFNCAGVNPTSCSLVDVSDDYYNKLLNANIRGVYNMTKHAIPFMRPGSSFVNVSSILGLHPAAGNAIYCATKYAVVGFSKAMALELGPQGIRVNVVAPGYIDTPTNASVLAGASEVEEMGKKVAVGRFGTADEVAEVVCFLFGDGASYVNGSVFEVNGGTG